MVPQLFPEGSPRPRKLRLDSARMDAEATSTICANTKGLTPDQTKEAVGKQASNLAAKLGITDPNVVKPFQAYFLDVFVARSYKELDQPLGDLPDGLSAQ